MLGNAAIVRTVSMAEVSIDITGEDGDDFVVENPHGFDLLVRGYGLNIEKSPEQGEQLWRALRCFYEDDDA